MFKNVPKLAGILVEKHYTILIRDLGYTFTHVTLASRDAQNVTCCHMFNNREVLLIHSLKIYVFFVT